MNTANELNHCTPVNEECTGCKHNKLHPNEDVTHTCTPANEWREEVVRKAVGDIVECMEADWEDFSIDKNGDDDEPTNFIVDPSEFMTEVITELLDTHSAHLVERYSELLLAVGNKHSGETRHETALRYIQNAEKPSDEATKVVESI